jgi:hypothetical protein
MLCDLHWLRHPKRWQLVTEDWLKRLQVWFGATPVAPLRDAYVAHCKKTLERESSGTREEGSKLDCERVADALHRMR